MFTCSCTVHVTILVVAVNSDQVQILWSYTLLLKPPVLMRSCYNAYGRVASSIYIVACRDCQERSEMCEISVGPGATQLSFNPLNWRQLCLMGPGRVTLWTLEQCDTQNLLSPMWVCQLPDIMSLVVY